ncbi:hypothetical protein PGIGA_G00222290 [Pangasianodon gigas]|uniref:Uncharacterized protein n=1 Tax=Pangasianodon gigas TaxID=30993 RepID=A0ACC5WIL1_PANGG|nr:hypothetical protein [Pangasianodon gigas]
MSERWQEEKETVGGARGVFNNAGGSAGTALVVDHPQRGEGGPDGIPGRVLRACAEQLAGIFTDIFNLSLAQTVVPACFKTTSIVPVPKHSSPACLNDYHPVALTLIVMKCFERLVLAHLKTCLPPTLDPHQFAYRSNRSTEDAVSTALHCVLSHLENKNTYARMLFVDFSLAFNTVIPSKLITKLGDLGISPSLCTWIMDFLTNRPQNVRSGHNCSTTITDNTGAPQGCVLSQFLYSLFTHDCKPVYGSNSIIKFADDTTVIGLISDNDESDYRAEVEHLAAWCTDNNLLLNTSKTKELIVDFRKEKSVPHDPIHINGMAVERVSSFKFLGTHISENLSCFITEFTHFFLRVWMMARYTGEEALRLVLDSDEEITFSSEEERDSDDERLHFEERVDPAEDISPDEALFEEGSLTSVPRGAGPASAEAERRLRSWGSQMDLAEGMETGLSLSPSSPSRSTVPSLGSEARSAVSSPRGADSALHLSSSEEVDVESVDPEPQSPQYGELLEVVTRAVAKLCIDWPAETWPEPRCSKLDEHFLRSRPPPPPRSLPFFPDLHTELTEKVIPDLYIPNYIFQLLLRDPQMFPSQL